MLNENAFAQCSCWSAACQMNICYTYQLLYFAATPYLILAIRIASAYCKEPINQLYYTNIVTVLFNKKLDNSAFISILQKWHVALFLPRNYVGKTPG